MAQGQEYYLDIRKTDTTGSRMNLIGELGGNYEDTAAIRLKLRQSLADIRSVGFLAASYDSVRVEEDTVTAWLYAGAQYHWGRFSLTASDSSLLTDIPFSGEIRKHKVIDLHELNALEERIVTYLENRGYPFASIEVGQLGNTRSDTLHATLFVNPGNRYIIDSIYIKGNDPVSEKYLYPYLGLYPGMVYDESKLQQISVNIENLAFLRQLRDFELEFSENRRVNVFLYLERARSNQVDGVVGFLPKGDGDIRFTGQLDLSLSNLFGRGEQLGVNWNSLEERSQELNLHFDYPYLFLQSVGVNADFELFKKDTGFLSRTLRTGMSFYVDSRSRLEVFGDFESSSLISSSADVRERYEPFQMRLYGVNYVFNNLDYRLNPSRGTDLEIFGSLGKRRRGEEKNGQTSTEAGVDISCYQPLFGTWVFKAAARGRYKYTWKEKDDAFRENELYRFGGFRSLRGFDDNAFMASAYSLVTLELRYLLSRNSNIYAFWDGGWYQGSIAQDSNASFPFGFGLGAHIDTGGGIMYIGYALGTQAGNPVDIGSAKIHLGYVSKF